MNDDPNPNLPPLPPQAFQRLDDSPDEKFYQQPRFVTHIDDGATAAVTALYRQWFPARGRILDLMSSWISHLPEEVEYRHVVGLGLNAEELAANQRLCDWQVHNLNNDPRLPYPDEAFDAAGCCVSIDYLTDPVAVLQDLSRVLVVDAPLVITFSNRCFPTKAVHIWQSLDDHGHLELVMQYLRWAASWWDIQPLDCRRGQPGDPLYAVVARNSGPKITAS